MACCRSSFPHGDCGARSRYPVLFLLSALIFFLPFPALAQEKKPVGTGTAPIEIDAGQALEWRRDENKYIARGQVVVTQGNAKVYGETVTADYRDGDGSMTIWRMTAEQSVRVQSGESTAYGEKAVYDVDQGVAIMTGGDLRLESPGQVVRARDRLEYSPTKGTAAAIGAASVTRTSDTLSADTITALFVKDPKTGKDAIKTLTATGNVVIKTPTETLYGKKGVYQADTNTAEITGDVRIERGQNRLNGARAEVNLTTSVSRMFGDDKGGRVTGLFYPGSKDPAKTQTP